MRETSLLESGRTSATAERANPTPNENASQRIPPAQQKASQLSRNLQPTFEHAPFRNPLFVLDPIVEAAAIDQIHASVELPVILADRIDLDHMRMINRRRPPRLLVQLREKPRLGHRLTAKQIQGDETIQPRGARFEDQAHPTGPERLDHFGAFKCPLHPQLKAAIRTGDFAKWIGPRRRDHSSAIRSRLRRRAVDRWHRPESNFAPRRGNRAAT
ncbi:MAG TPA: hypothetical protein VGI85_04485 [Chthoniobacterales bacterium]